MQTTDPIKSAQSHLGRAIASCQKESTTAKKETLNHLSDAAGVLYDAKHHDLSADVEGLKSQISGKHPVGKKLSEWKKDIEELSEKVGKLVPA